MNKQITFQDVLTGNYEDDNYHFLQTTLDEVIDFCRKHPDLFEWEFQETDDSYLVFSWYRILPDGTALSISDSDGLFDVSPDDLIYDWPITLRMTGKDYE